MIAWKANENLAALGVVMVVGEGGRGVASLHQLRVANSMKCRDAEMTILFQLFFCSCLDH